MRPARLNPGNRPAVVLVAHGSRDPRAAASTEALARAVRRSHPEWTVHASYLDHAGPRPLDVLTGLPPGRRAVVVPLLLTAAYHGRVDVPAIVAEAAGLPLDVRLAEVLGPSSASAPAACSAASATFHTAVPTSRVSAPLTSWVSALLIDGLIRRLPPAGLDAVVLAAAGTRDAAARETIGWVAEAVSVRLGLPCSVAYASAAPPTTGEVVKRLRAGGARRVGMAAYFLAPGRLYDLAARSAVDAGAVAVADPLGDAPELVRLVAARVESAVARPLATAA